MHTCKLCLQPMTFSPSLAERSKQSGLPIEHYKQIFTTHSECQTKEWYKPIKNK